MAVGSTMPRRKTPPCLPCPDDWPELAPEPELLLSLPEPQAAATSARPATSAPNRAPLPIVPKVEPPCSSVQGDREPRNVPRSSPDGPTCQGRIPSGTHPMVCPGTWPVNRVA